MTPILTIDSLSVEFFSKNQTFKAVDNISFSINPGEFAALVGESGSGKTMTALSIMNLLPEGASVTKNAISFKGKNKSIIFQEPMTSLNPTMRVGAQIEESLKIHTKLTKEERRNPSILKASRKIRIAKGSGRSVEEVNRLLKQFEEMKKMMKMFKSGNFKMPF